MDTEPHEHFNHPTLGNLARPMNALTVGWRVFVERSDVLTPQARRAWLEDMIAEADRLKAAALSLLDSES